MVKQYVKNTPMIMLNVSMDQPVPVSCLHLEPVIIPDRFESGTVNFPGLAGLGAGVDFVSRRGVKSIYNHEIALAQRIYDSFRNMDNIELYTDYPEYGSYAPVISFNIKGRGCEEVADILSEKYNIAVRSGLHCAPLAHKSKNTFDFGTVRAVPSVFTTKTDVYKFVSSVFNIK